MFFISTTQRTALSGKGDIIMRSIVQTGSKKEAILQRPTATIQSDNKPQIKRLVNMLMNEFRGRKGIAAGIALNQLNSHYSAFIAKINGDGKVFINPTITKYHLDPIVVAEGCLSIKKGKKIYMVERHKVITLNYYCYFNDKYLIETFSGTDAQIIQHEVDHLNGVTIHDRSAEWQQHKETN